MAKWRSYYPTRAILETSIPHDTRRHAASYTQVEIISLTVAADYGGDGYYDRDYPGFEAAEPIR